MGALEKYGPFKRQLCRCAEVKCMCCELIEALEAETVARREAEGAIEFAVNGMTHVSRFRFLLSWLNREEMSLLHWPSWISARERIRANV